MLKLIQTSVEDNQRWRQIQNPMQTTYIRSHGKSCHLGDVVAVKGLNMLSTIDISKQCDVQMDSAIY